MKFSSSFTVTAFICKSGRWVHRPRRYVAVGVHTNRKMGKGNFILKQLLTVTVFFLCFIAPGISCKRSNSPATENVVYYYPEKNIYYDSLKSNYYYSLDGARSWDSMIFKGPGAGAALGPKVAIKKMDNNIWANNALHRKEYNGVLLNIINNQTIAISKADRINKLKDFVKSETQKAAVEKEPPPKKGLKNFFNKLFGKKKKQAEEK